MEDQTNQGDSSVSVTVHPTGFRAGVMQALGAIDRRWPGLRVDDVLFAEGASGYMGPGWTINWVTSHPLYYAKPPKVRLTHSERVPRELAARVLEESREDLVPEHAAKTRDQLLLDEWRAGTTLRQSP